MRPLKAAAEHLHRAADPVPLALPRGSRPHGNDFTWAPCSRGTGQHGLVWVHRVRALTPVTAVYGNEASRGSWGIQRGEDGRKRALNFSATERHRPSER